jgi:hypothetical protein
MAVVAGGAIDPASRIEKLISYHDRQFQSTFLMAVNTIKDAFTLEELATLLSQGRLEEALQAVEKAAALMGNQYGAALTNSAQNTAAYLTNEALTVAVNFDQTNTRAVQAISENRLRLVREFSNGQRATLRAAMTDGIREGLNPIDQARNFRDSVGLTQRQQAAVSNYRRLLNGNTAEMAEASTRRLHDGRSTRSVRRAISNERPLPQAQIDSMVSRYQSNYVRYRSEVIGRTEALRAAHQGSEEMYTQAFESGDLDPNAVTRTWLTANDGRVRDTHDNLSGQERSVGETWASGGSELRFPGDPNAAAAETVQCRCVLTTRMSGNG